MIHKKLGAAIDIGTTTVALYLTDMETGKRLAVKSGVNTQSSHGADVTSRILYCSRNGHETLTKLIREQISSMLSEACRATGTQADNIEYITVAGNTIMQHLAAGYSPASMGTAPFTPVSLFGEETPVWDELPVSRSAKIFYTPAVSAYVGGDVTAGLLATGFESIPEPAIFLDIGTNGEMVIKCGKTYYCCATAAGPAFEGAEITMGMAAADGAVDHVNLNKDSNSIEYSVIGGGVPVGLCGSGLLDTLAMLLETGAVDETGRLDRDRFWLNKNDGIYITAGDIRKLQLAKAAIAAGIQVLLHYAGIPVSDVKSLTIAGGFGSYMEPESAARIGLFPKSLLPKAKISGNTAGEGAVMALTSEDARTQLKNIKSRCECIELSASAFFNEKFVEQMAF